ncbi:MAG: hypothetical protein IJY94_06020, partial [Clostridia bacterium]|nr:hypothetical protein [Clostridia bacterium]
MKKRIITLVIVIAVLIMPTVIALSSYIYAINNPVTEGSVSKLVITVPSGESETYLKSDKENKSLCSALIGMHKNTRRATSLPAAASEFAIYKVAYSSYNKTFEYTYYISSDPSNCLFRNESGKLFKVAKKNAVAFLRTDLAADVFPDASQPVLNVGSTENVLPSAMNWKYIGINGSFVDGDVNTSNGKPT